MPIPELVLADRLRRLVTLSVLDRRAGVAETSHREYWLTERGLELWTILIAIRDWEGQYAVSRRGRASDKIIHTRCGHAIHPVLSCGHCGVSDHRPRHRGRRVRPGRARITARGGTELSPLQRRQSRFGREVPANAGVANSRRPVEQHAVWRAVSWPARVRRIAQLSVDPAGDPRQPSGKIRRSRNSATRTPRARAAPPLLSIDRQGARARFRSCCSRSIGETAGWQLIRKTSA